MENKPAAWWSSVDDRTLHENAAMMRQYLRWNSNRFAAVKQLAAGTAEQGEIARSAGRKRRHVDELIQLASMEQSVSAELIKISAEKVSRRRLLEAARI